MKKLALLGILMLVSIGTASAASAFGALQGIIVVPEKKIVPIPADVDLSAEQKALAESIALADPRIHQEVEKAEGYETQVSCDYRATAEDRKLIIIPENEKAIVEIRLYEENDQVCGLKKYFATVDLGEGKVVKIEISEMYKPQPAGNIQRAVYEIDVENGNAKVIENGNARIIIPESG